MVSARLPPTWRWMLMAIPVHRMLVESIRSARCSRLSSMSAPIRVSARARENSLAEGSAASLAAAQQDHAPGQTDHDGHDPKDGPLPRAQRQVGAFEELLGSRR